MEIVHGFLNWFNDNIIWGAPMLIFMVFVGALLTVRSGFFQFRFIKKIISQTVLSLFKGDKRHSSDLKAISQFQSVTTALAATIGTGNIAGVATAITVGGPGAVFWMWVSSLFGLMTAYGENVLGIYYRRRNASGEWSGGPMYYLKDGLKGRRFLGAAARPLAFLFAFFCMLAALGMGNMTQINTVGGVLKNAFNGFSVPAVWVGVISAFLIGIIIFGGTKRIGRVTEKLVPIMAGCYILGCLVVMVLNYKNLSGALTAIFKGAFGFQAVGGGISGAVIKKAVNMGFRRGVFSNEAGLGSSVIVGAASDVREPAVQGMWGMFSVFFDTLLGCSLTAFALLSSGVVDLSSGKSVFGFNGAELVSLAFSKTLGEWAGGFVGVMTVLFAFSTVIGWSYYGTKAAEYIFGEGKTTFFKILFIFATFLGAVLEMEVVWRVSDTFNGLMAIPNLIGVVALSREIISITNNYVEREIRGKKKVLPKLSYFKK